MLRSELLDGIKLLPDKDGYILINAFNENGFDIKFEAASSELKFAPTIEQRGVGKLSSALSQGQTASSNLTSPASLAGYFNLRAGADYVTQSFFDPNGQTNARFGLDGAMRWRNVVLESGAVLSENGEFSRNSSRFIYDVPEDALRFAVGDVSPAKLGLQGGSDLLGVSVEKSYQKLQPGTSIHPTGSQSFRIERPSHVDVVINGHVAQRLNLRPGDYDLSDLPLMTGANDISLVIEDDLGQRRTLSFSVFSGLSLLAPGVSEWSLSAGVASRYSSKSRTGLDNLYRNAEYDYTAPMITGFYQHGLTDDFTGVAHLQADTNVIMGGAGGGLQTSFGFWAFDAAVSEAFEYGPGFAGYLAYDLVNIEGFDAVRRSLRVAANYRSREFAASGIAGGASNDVMLSLSASYTQTLPWELSGGLSGTYALGRGDADDHFGVDVSLGRSFASSISAGVSAGYGQSLGSHNDANSMEGFRASVRVSYLIDENSGVDTEHDFGSGHSRASYRHREGSGVGSWTAQMEVDRTPAIGDGSDTYGVNGLGTYTANRAELSVSQHTGLAGLNTDRVEQRTSAAVGTAIAFADGSLAVGRPVSNSFAIVGAHANLPDSDVEIGGHGRKRAFSDMLGPALVSELSPYSPTSVAVDVTNLPDGYDLGAGGFDLFVPYKGGYRLTVGSDYTVTAMGSLVNEQGEPIPLLTGDAYEEGHQDGKHVEIFTNKAGKFGAQGMRPGRWIVEMATEPKTRFIIEVPQGTVGLLKLETLRPVKS